MGNKLRKAANDNALFVVVTGFVLALTVLALISPQTRQARAADNGANVTCTK